MAWLFYYYTWIAISVHIVIWPLSIQKGIIICNYSACFWSRLYHWLWLWKSNCPMLYRSKITQLFVFHLEWHILVGCGWLLVLHFKGGWLRLISIPRQINSPTLKLILVISPLDRILILCVLIKSEIWISVCIWIFRALVDLNGV